MAIPHAKPGEVVDVRPLGSALASAHAIILAHSQKDPAEAPSRCLNKHANCPRS
jgi:hypothetical protein